MDYIVTWKWTPGQGTFIPGTSSTGPKSCVVLLKEYGSKKLKDDLRVMMTVSFLFSLHRRSFTTEHIPPTDIPSCWRSTL